MAAPKPVSLQEFLDLVKANLQLGFELTGQVVLTTKEADQAFERYMASSHKLHGLLEGQLITPNKVET